MRAASGMFESAELERLAPRSRGGAKLAELNGEGIAGLDPLSATEAIAYDFLVKGGKHSRPFITLAVYDALTGGKGTLGDGAGHLASLPDSVKRAALADRNLPQGVAGPRRHRGRRHLPLRPGDAASPSSACPRRSTSATT